MHSSSHSLIPVSEGATVASAEISLQDVAAQAGINRLEILDHECSQQVLLGLAKHCVDWQLIGFHLELTKADIVAVDGDFRSIDEKRIGMLGRWKEKFAFKATYRAFIEALLSCGKASDAIEACKAIVSGTCMMSNLIKLTFRLILLYMHTGVKSPAKAQVMFNSSMPKEDFFKWLESRGISDEDCKTLSSKCVSVTEYT